MDLKTFIHTIIAIVAAGLIVEFITKKTSKNKIT